MTQKKQSSNTSTAQPSKSVWYQGPIADGLQLAIEQNRPVLIYWGAVWCPPCAEIKSQVFSHPDFPSLMAPFVAIEIDGDAAGAQKYSDKFQISGYPTILVLDQNKEIMRIDHGTSFDEFATALNAAYTSREPLTVLADRAVRGKANVNDWPRIAYQNGQELTDATDKKARLTRDLELFQQCPNSLVQIRSRLAAHFLQHATQWTKEKRASDKEFWQTVEHEFPSAIDSIFSSHESIKAARSTLIYNATEIVSMVATTESEKSQLQTKWLQAMQALTNDQSLSIDTRLWSVFPSIDFYKASNPEKKALPSELVSQVILTVQTADRRATTPTDRKAVISGAAYLLRQVGEFDRARALLRKELAVTKTPWYYHSSLASLEKDAGNDKQAAVWSKKARESAEGRATKLQWIVADLQLASKNTTNVTGVRELVEEYYSTAFDLEDGWSGRNALRATFVGQALKPWMQNSTIRPVILSFSKNCKEVEAEQVEFCQKHFTSLASVDP